VSELVPLGLRNALEAGEAVLFAGAGLGMYLVDHSGALAPDGAQLANELAADADIAVGESAQLPKIAQVVEIRKGREYLERFVTLRLRDLKPLETLDWLPRIRWRAIFTTNYDRGIETVYAKVASPVQNPISISAASGIVNWNSAFEVPIVHLHGVIDDPAKSRLMITQDDYVRYATRRRMLFAMLKQYCATSPILYIGYSHEDEDWRRTFEELREEFFPDETPPSYRLAPATDPLTREILESKRLRTLDGSIADLAAEVSAVPSEPAVTAIIERARARVPSELATIFDRNPAAATRLLDSWKYVNQADWSAAPNIQAFLKGDQPNWALVGADIPFERDETEQALDDVLDYLTSGVERPHAILITGSAGYGMTTVLMTLAARLVKERAGPVFSLGTTAALSEGDVEFAVASLGDTPIFLVDNAARSARPLAEILQRLRNERRRACFLLAERLNEWRAARPALRPEEHLIEPLSDAEIDRLLGYLESHHALNKLEALEPALRVAAVKEKHEKQLLVAMKEATEGTPFDAIIESEFRNLPAGLARELYAVVSCAFSVRELVRDRVVAAVLGETLPRMYDSTRDSTEGVVIWELIAEETGEYAARTRHQVISDIVWERCVTAGERERFVLKLVDQLNVTVLLDRRLFDRLVQSDRHIDGIGTLEAKTKFFELACRKQPDNAYVRQHYARMLLRANLPSAALSQIDEAIEMAPGARVLQHTKGKVLASLAVMADGLEIGRKYLARGEAAYKASMGSGRDNYAYHGLAELYFEWARRPGIPEDESLSYLEKAEDVINDGLSRGAEKGSLLILSAKIQGWFGDQPGALAALERAVAANPAGAIARYLLGRSYLKAGRADRAIEILQPAIERDPNAYRSCSAYADALIARGDAYEAAIAVLQLGSLFGMSDPRFVAKLGGLLFANGDFSDAAKIFRQGREKGFSQSEIRMNEVAIPRRGEPGSPIRLKGRVTKVSVGYAWISVQEYPEPFFCPGSKFGGLVMRKDLHVSFELVFNAVGPLARNVAEG
jgi:Flp pilus assembly protein TadD, contains TPR repeats